jgi:hypothetical protein
VLDPLTGRSARVQTWSTGNSAAATTPPAPWKHSPPACASRSQEHHGDRGHEDIGIEETLLRGDP